MVMNFMRVVFAVFICLFFFSIEASCQQPSVREITIESATLKLLIQFRDGKSYLGNVVVDSNRITALLAALGAPLLPAPEAGNLGITDKWLRQNADTFRKTRLPNQEALFQQNFSDMKLIQQLLPFCFRFTKFDDYPEMQVKILFTNGQHLTAASNSYYPFMLPWKVKLKGREGATYNADISRAVAALMPIGSLNRERLSDEELKTELAHEVMTHIRPQWDLSDIEKRAPESFAILRNNFEVERASINSHRSLDYGYVGNETGPHEENLLATLRKPSLSPHTAEDVVLLFHDGQIEGVKDLRERIAPYEALSLSVPWVNRYLADHPEQDFYIRFVHDRSFSAKAMQNFAADMRIIGRESLAKEVSLVQEKAALVFLDYGSDWIILPDKRMILWRHYLPASFLKWKQSDFTIQRCADYNANDGGCVGAVVLPDGTLQR